VNSRKTQSPTKDEVPFKVASEEPLTEDIVPLEKHRGKVNEEKRRPSKIQKR
jgi:hypothetical protein